MNLHPDFIKCDCKDKNDIISMCAAFRMILHNVPCCRCNDVHYYHKQFGSIKDTTVTAEYTRFRFANNVVTYDKYGNVIKDVVPLDPKVPIDLKHITVP